MSEQPSSEKSDTIIEKADKIRTDAQDELKSRATALKKQAQNAWNKVVDYTTEHPAATLGITLGLGFLLGALTRLFKSDSEDEI